MKSVEWSGSDARRALESSSLPAFIYMYIVQFYHYKNSQKLENLKLSKNAKSTIIIISSIPSESDQTRRGALDEDLLPRAASREIRADLARASDPRLIHIIPHTQINVKTCFKFTEDKSAVKRRISISRYWIRQSLTLSLVELHSPNKIRSDIQNCEKCRSKGTDFIH